MTAKDSRGGEADAHRLLALARRELLESLLPQLDGEARYRARLIANALKIAAGDVETGATMDAATRAGLQAVAEALGSGAAAGSDAALRAALAAAIRAGRLDGDPALFRVLTRLTEARRAATG
ncbi:MAG: hypothetical protein Kow00114_19920 [Kiloniellaceae bacterium]